MLNSLRSAAYCTLLYFWTQLDSARLLPVGTYEELDLRDLCGIRERLAGLRLRLQRILDYQVLVIVCTRTRYVGTVYVLKSLVVTWSPFCKWTQEKNNKHTVSSRSGGVQHVMWW